MTASAQIKLLTVDLDDTLWPCEPPIRLAEAQLLAWLAVWAPRVAQTHDRTSLRQHRLALMRDRTDLAHDVTALRRESLRRLLQGFGYPTDLADEGMAVFLDARNRVEPFPEVVPALRTLAGRYCLVSVTNGNSDLERTPLRGLFHHSLTAAAVGAAKPDPALFLSALALAGAAPWEAIHLGDDPALDVAPAQGLGIRAVWVNRFGRQWPAHRPPPNAEVSDLDGFRLWLEGSRTSDRLRLEGSRTSDLWRLDGPSSAL
jgi:FMN hydrolase / 5-amino-6-(5-phospho-D-ribitylamino)uracil phosphatase